MKTRTFIASTLIGGLMVSGFTLAPGSADAAAPDANTRASEQRIPGKPQAPVDIRYRFDSEPAVGQPMTVTVYVTPLIDSEALSAEYRTKGNIGLSRSHSEWGTDELGRDSRIYTLEVTPGSEGRSLVQVIATIQIAGTLQNRAVSIPIQIGEAGAKPVATYSGKVSLAGSGETVVSLPAETEIIPVETE